MSSGNRGGGDRGRGGFRGDRGGGGGFRGDRGGGGFRGDRGGGFRGDRGGGGGFRGDRGGGRGRGAYGGGSQEVQVFSNPQQLSAKVAKLEATLHPATKKTLDLKNVDLKSLSLGRADPVRPGYGTRGVKVTLTANYVELLPPSKLDLYRYDLEVHQVGVEEPVKGGGKLARVVQILLQLPELAAFRSDLASDFRSTVISKTRLPNDEMIFQIPYRAEGEDEPSIGAKIYRTRLAYTNTLQVDELLDYLNSTSLGARCENQLELVQAFNIFLNHYAKSANNLATIGSSKTFSISSTSGRGNLGQGLEVIRGFFSSVRVAACRVLVNINVSHGAFYCTGPLPALMEEFGSRSLPALEKFLKLVRVQTVHLPEKRNKAGQVIPRIKTIFGLARNEDGRKLAHPPKVTRSGAGAKEVQFWLDGEGAPSGGSKGTVKGKGGKAPTPASSAGAGKYISVFDFFKTTYNRVLQRPDLPLINCGNRDNPMYLPPEVCIVVPGQAAKTKLNSPQTQEMIRYAVRKPWENATSILEEGVQTVGLDERTNQLLVAFGLKVAPGLIKVAGRILNGPKVMYKGKSADTRFGSWNMASIKFNAGASLKRWSCLMISRGHGDAFPDAQSLTKVLQVFYQALKTIGMEVAPPQPPGKVILKHPDDPALEDKMKNIASNSDFLFVILPDDNPILYKRIKTLADRKFGLHTVCSIGKKLAKEKGQDQYMANVALKFNLKLGGINQRLEKNLPLVDQGKTMVVGIDVTHPAPGAAKSAPSVSAMVASVDQHLGQWPAVLRVQKGRQEEVKVLTEMLGSRLELWRNKHGALPHNILVYRDGVSEGQFDMVTEKEVPQLRDACQKLYPATDTKANLPRITVIVCGKRHKTRFYPTAEQDCDRSGNTKPGTVVDTSVTNPHKWDFFLQAHAALQGTARPCHYYILHDEIFRQFYAKGVPPPYVNIADVVEDLTHNMCYLFGRATKAVSLCPPAYYADLACERARCYIGNLIDAQDMSSATSVTGSTAGDSELGANNDDVTVHEKLKNTMFYI